jgi:putative heme iron utilization protein
VRRLLRAADRATLATALAGPPAAGPAGLAAGWPYASLVLLAVDQDAAPLLLISDLAEHTRNIRADPRVSLLVDGTAGLAEPLTGARASLLARAVPCDAAAARARYVARHPSAAGYAGFKDFHLFRLELVAAHLVAGFGRIHWAAADDILDRPAPALAAAEPGIVDHMNVDHADALMLMARAAGLPDGSWAMTGIDPEGIDLRLDGKVGRVEFSSRVEDAAAARAELVRLTRAARDVAPVP